MPGAGPKTSRTLAEAALVRGETRNSLLGGLPEGRPLIELEKAEVPPKGGPAIVLALPRGGEQPNDRRYPIAVLGRGYRGLLVSDSTRIPGLVSVVDVAPTARGEEDALGFRPHAHPAGALAELDARIDAKEDTRAPAFLLALGLVAVLAVVAPRAALLGVAAALLANLALGLAGASTLWVVLLVVGLAVGLVAPLLAAAVRSPLAVGLVTTAVLAAYLAALAADGPSVALSPLGPTQNARFYGLSNLLATLLLVPALAGAALLAGRAGPFGFALVAALALVTVGSSRLGADGGGAIVLAVGFALLAVALAGWSRRAVGLAVAAGVAVLLALVGIDAAAGGSSHVTDSIRGGPEELASDLGRRLTLSYKRSVDDWSLTLIVAIGVAALVALLVALVRRGRPGPACAPLLATAGALAVSLVVNDSPNDVVLAGLACCLAVVRYPFALSSESDRRPALRARPHPGTRRRR